jgi:phosphoribosylaminoimidazole-succinocarboxamide synthase
VNPPLTHTELPLPRIASGKVRDLYAIDDKRMLVVASDRLSAFDVVFNEGVTGKGRILTELSSFWAQALPPCEPYHLILPQPVPPVPEELWQAYQARSQVVERLEMVPIECVVRGFLTGSGWKEYQSCGRICGEPLPEGLLNGDALPSLMFTPAYKAEAGAHDENISLARAAEIVGRELLDALITRSLAIFEAASAHAAKRGLILVDTKFEFGRRSDGTLVLADEVLTPDSSRYWDAEEHAHTPRGETPQSFDKQVVRDYLETLDWDKRPPPPSLPKDVLEKTAARYRMLLERITGPER